MRSKQILFSIIHDQNYNLENVKKKKKRKEKEVHLHIYEILFLLEGRCNIFWSNFNDVEIRNK